MRTLSIALITIALAGSATAATMAVIPKIGTAGYGVDFAFGTPSIQARVEGQTGSYSRNVHEENLEYDGKLKLGSIGGVVDFYPGGSGFRVSAGVFSNRNKVDLVANGTGTYTVNGVQYPASTIGTITGDVKFKSTAPYVGIGFGNPLNGSGRIGVTFDIGALYQGAPALTLVPHPTNPAAVPPAFYTNLEAERAKTEQDLSKYKWYPAVSLGVVIRF